MKQAREQLSFFKNFIKNIEKQKVGNRKKKKKKFKTACLEY